jgi:uncharacterized protein (TIGR00290 family)
MKAFMNWSGGKDSALCLYKALNEGINIEALVTTLSNGRVTMHGVPKELIGAQALAIGLPVYFMELDQAPGMESYESAVHRMNQQLLENKFTHVISGDIHLQDLKEYRESLYQKDGLNCLFPLWNKDPRQLINEFEKSGFRAIIIAINGDVLNETYCGKFLDKAFVASLPVNADVCGENGEYHSFVFDGPLFNNPVAFTKGAIIKKDYPRPKTGTECFTDPAPLMDFYFQELLP